MRLDLLRNKHAIIKKQTGKAEADRRRSRTELKRAYAQGAWRARDTRFAGAFLAAEAGTIWNRLEPSALHAPCVPTSAHTAWSRRCARPGPLSPGWCRAVAPCRSIVRATAWARVTPGDRPISEAPAGVWGNGTAQTWISYHKSQCRSRCTRHPGVKGGDAGAV